LMAIVSSDSCFEVLDREMSLVLIDLQTAKLQRIETVRISGRMRKRKEGEADNCIKNSYQYLITNQSLSTASPSQVDHQLPTPSSSSCQADLD